MRNRWLAWAVYGPLAIVGGLWAHLAHGSAWRYPGVPWLPWPPAARYAAAAGGALALAAATVITSRWLVTRAAWARRLHLELRAALAGTPPSQLPVLALTSALGEELLFRAALQPSLGLLATSLLFGVVHVAPNGNWLSWALWASLMGLAFGALYAATGTLLGPVLAHGVINYENMQYICNYDPTPLDTDRHLPTRGRNRGGPP